MTERLRMLSTRRGSPDGFQVNSYQAGHVYELPPDLAAAFLREGWAEPADRPKDAGPAPENKMLRPSQTKAIHKGFGRWYLIDAEGVVQSGPHCKEIAQKMAGDIT
jgi:hypothetical protein